MDLKPYRHLSVKRGPVVAALALMLSTSGCATPWEKSALLSDNTPNIERIQGPTQRSLMNWKKKKQDDEIKAGQSLKPIKGTEEYLAATKLFEQGEYENARKEFKQVASRFKKSEIREDALFMQAECAWKQDHYATAHDAYAVLLKDYPSTRHMNVVAERMFKIGRLWLEFPEVASMKEIRQVNFDKPTEALPSEEPPKVPKPVPIFVPNFSDKSKPLFDTAGNGVACLTAVWMNDPNGPLADDAMMLVASYYARRGNWVEADRYFQMLRETFPHSQHVENAFVLGSHVKLMSYMGPDYEGRTLQEAQLLKESTMKLFPGNPEVDRMKDELARIEEAKAHEIWHAAELYLRKGKPRAAAVYCHRVIHEYPKSSFAKLARAKLVELGPEYTNGAILLTPEEAPNNDLLYRVLETPPTYRLKKYPMIGPAREDAKPSQSAKAPATQSTDKGTSRKPAENKKKDRDYEEPADEVERSPNVDPEAPPKKRRSWYPFGSPPDRLPEDAADGAKRVTPNPSGKVSL